MNTPRRGAGFAERYDRWSRAHNEVEQRRAMVLVRACSIADARPDESQSELLRWLRIAVEELHRAEAVEREALEAVRS